MPWESWLTLLVLSGMIITLARDVVAPSVAVIGAVVVLLVAGVITPGQAFGGFSNSAPITVAALYVVSRAVQKTRALQPFVGTTLGAGGSQRWTLARLLTPTAVASAFLNNTPIVAMLVPQVTSWAQQNEQSPSRYLMPLSFAAIFGGMITLIGTSTNLVVSGLLTEAGEPPLSMFELTPVGLPIAVLGIGALLLLSPTLLPDRRPARADLSDEYREFVVKMAVVDGGPLDGRTVDEGRLRRLQGVFLVELAREDEGEVIAPVTPDTVLRGGDLLTFVGRSDVVVDVQTTAGLVSSEHKHLTEFDTADTFSSRSSWGPPHRLWVKRSERRVSAADIRPPSSRYTGQVGGSTRSWAVSPYEWATRSSCFRTRSSRPDGVTGARSCWFHGLAV